MAKKTPATVQPIEHKTEKVYTPPLAMQQKELLASVNGRRKGQTVAAPESISKSKSSAVQSSHIYRIISRTAIALIFLIPAALFVLYATQMYQKSDSLHYLREAVLRNTNDANAHFRLGEYYEQRNLFEDARREYTFALLFGRADAQLHLDRVVEKEHYPQQIRQSLAIWQAFVSQQPHWRDGWLQIAFWWYELGEKDKAREAVGKVIALDPDYEPALQLSDLLRL